MEMGTQSRCFCDVSDVGRAITGLAQHPEAPGRLYNIGASEEVRIQELAERVKMVTESCSEIVHIPYTEAYARGFEDMLRRVPDTSRIQALLGWHPQLSLEQILVRVRDDLQARFASTPKATPPSAPTADASLLRTASVTLTGPPSARSISCEPSAATSSASVALAPSAEEFIILEGSFPKVQIVDVLLHLPQDVQALASRPLHLMT